MPSDFKTDSLLVRYLLGEASPEECSDLEARYIADSDLFEELVAAENDLIDVYARGQLTDADRRKLEEHFLVTPERQQRVEFAKALLNHGAAEDGGIQHAGRELPGLRPPLTVLNHWSAVVQLVVLVFFAVMVAFSIWMTIQSFRLGKEVARLQVEIADLREKEKALGQQILELQANNSRSEGNRQNQTPSIASLTLNPGIPRGNGADDSVAISSGTRFVRLQLVLEDHGYSKLEAAIETANGVKVWQAKNLRTHAGHEAKVDLTVPAKILASGDYIVNLSAVESGGKTGPINAYAFRVIRR